MARCAADSALASCIRARAAPTDDEREIHRTAWQLFLDGRLPRKPVRLIGVGISGFEEPHRQLGLWDDPDQIARAAAADLLRHLFGGSGQAELISHRDAVAQARLDRVRRFDRAARRRRRLRCRAGSNYAAARLVGCHYLFCDPGSLRRRRFREQCECPAQEPGWLPRRRPERSDLTA